MSIAGISCTAGSISSSDMEILRRLNEYEQEVVIVTDQYNRKGAEITSVNQQIQTQRELIAKLEGDLVDKRNERNRTRNERERIEAENAQEYAIYNDLGKRIQEDTNKLNSLQTRLEVVKADFERIREDALQSGALRYYTSNRVWTNNSPLAQRLRENLSNLGDQENRLKSDIDSLKTRISAEQERRESFRDEAEANERAINDERKAQQIFDEVNQHLTSANQTLQEMENQKIQLQEEEESLRQSLETLQEDLSKARRLNSDPSIQRTLRLKRIFPFLK